AIEAGLGVSLVQSEASIALKDGDEAVLIGLSFGVLLAWAEDKIAPLAEDWRCLSLIVQNSSTAPSAPALETAVVEPISSNEGRARVSGNSPTELPQICGVIGKPESLV